MDNYEFCARWTLGNHSPGSALDFGCGAGEIVRQLRARGVEAFGCDVFYEGGNYSVFMDPELLDAGVIRKMEGGVIPFEDESFDAVVSNQVLEHVEDLDAVLAEIQRVLRPGGEVLSLFPDRGVWREGHSGIPFLHWFPAGSRARIWYGAALRGLGLGHHTQGKSSLQWSRDFCRWLDQWTHYRSRAEIDAAFTRHFEDVRHIEEQWLEQRFGGPLTRLMPVPLRRFVVRKLAGLVFTARKAG